MRIITLLTDFGLRDPFVGEMKAVLLGLAPEARLVDLTHGVTAGGVREAAWILRKAWELFPAGTCHLVVVDPGVGGSRRALAASAGGHVFVGPDNGVLAPALASAGEPQVREIAVRELDRVRRGTTFDGRDVFAPAAARLARGAELAEFGPEIRDFLAVASFVPEPVPGGWSVEIVRADHFGNLVTTAEEDFLRRELGERWREARVRIGESWIEGIRLSYGEVAEGESLLSIGGSGTLEVSVNRGSARERHGAEPGERVLLAAPPD